MYAAVKLWTLNGWQKVLIQALLFFLFFYGSGGGGGRAGQGEVLAGELGGAIIFICICNS